MTGGTDPAAPADAAGVWDLVVRADDLVKYASNRDEDAAYTQARETLERAADAAARLEDRTTGERLAEQIQVRLADLARRGEA